MLPISKDDLIERLKTAVRCVKNFIADLTEYHGGTVATEYLLTSDIARAFIGGRNEVRVECLNRDVLGALNCADWNLRRKFKSRRTDVAVTDSSFPTALIEVKIRVKTFAAIKADVQKICTTLAAMTPNDAANCWGVVVYEIHLPASRSKPTLDQLVPALREIERAMDEKVAEYAAERPAFQLETQPLQEPNEGIEDFGVQEGADEREITDDPHITRYYALLIKRTK